MTYAEKTTVPVERSRAELERTLTRYGATAFGYLTDPHKAVIMFEAHGRRIRFDLPLPDRTSREFTISPTGKKRPDTAALASWEQACRQKWRALNLAVKA